MSKRIYIASSWKNQHAVQMLTKMIREMGYEVDSFIEQRGKDEYGAEDNSFFDLDKWVASDEGAEKFAFDTESAMNADLVVYVGSN